MNSEWDHPDDNYDWSNESDAKHACHQPTKPAQERSTSDEAGQEGIAALRAIVGIKPAEPKRIDTTDIESGLELTDRNHSKI